jgi:hypothetical protein
MHVSKQNNCTECWKYVSCNYIQSYLEFLIFGTPQYESNMYLCMELLYMFTMLVGIYLSVKSLRKLDDYQWNTVYFVFILEILLGLH